MGFQFKFEEFPYTTGEVAKLLNHPKLGRNNLRKFLREQGILEDQSPAQQYVDLKYFSGDTVVIGYQFLYDRIKVSPAGVDFIDKLIKEKLNPVKSA